MAYVLSLILASIVSFIAEVMVFGEKSPPIATHVIKQSIRGEPLPTYSRSEKRSYVFGLIVFFVSFFVIRRKLEDWL